MRIVDLFSGAGGLTFGFYYKKRGNNFVRNRGNSFVFANEFDSNAAEAFSANYPDIRMLNQDIKTLDEETIRFSSSSCTIYIFQRTRNVPKFGR